MSLFAKPEYREISLPFIFDDNPDDLNAGMVSIEAYGNILGENKYCYASYCVNIDYIDEIAQMLENCIGKSVKVVLKLKKGNVKDFTIDLESLANAYNDERFKKLELSAWGFNDKSFKETSLI